MPLQTMMQYGEEWAKCAEINVAFVAMTRSYADLIFLRHLEPEGGVVDFGLLWPQQAGGVKEDEEEVVANNS